jgi:hypothetical protein
MNGVDLFSSRSAMERIQICTYGCVVLAVRGSVLAKRDNKKGGKLWRSVLWDTTVGIIGTYNLSEIPDEAHGYLLQQAVRPGRSDV